MMTRRCRWACLALASILAGPRAGHGDGPRSAPPFTEGSIPDPPEQRAPWAPPESRLPRFLLSATTTLFDQGLADPRGCEYRSIELVASSPLGGGGVVATRGWALPAAEGRAPRFAVAWDGLVYPALSVGEPADLAGDVRALLAAKVNPGPGRPGWAGRPAGPRGSRNFGPPPAISATSPATLLPMKVCLLLRLGRGDLAEAVWEAGSGLPAAKVPAAGPDLNSYGVSYLSLATDWAWARFERAIAAHVRGDDALALVDARALAAIGPAVGARAEELGFSKSPDPDAQGRPMPYLPFLRQWAEFLADHERRAAEAARPPIPPPGGDRSARIAALIRDLDRAAVVPWARPGGVGLGQAPAVLALVAEGEEAVDPLIAAVRDDARLTRTVRSWDAGQERNLLGASEAAYEALAAILKMGFTDKNPPFRHEFTTGKAGRDALAGRIAAYWGKFRAVPLVERRHRVLADDRADPTAWVQAAREIAGTDRVAFGREPRGGIKPPGETLRDAREPSVSELMAKRVETLLRRPLGGPDQALAMARALQAWDPPAALPPLREVSRSLLERSRRKPGDPSGSIGGSLATLALDRLRSGEPGGAGDFAAWLRSSSTEDVGHSLFPMLEPLYRHPGDPDLAGAAEWLFNDPRSAWVPLFAKGRRGAGYQAAELISSPLLAVPGFRRMVLRALDDRSFAGSCHLDRDGGLRYKMEAGWSGGRGQSGGDPLAPAADVEVAFRVADLYAWELASVEGAPAFEPYWPEARRDEGLAAMKAYLVRFADRFAARPPGDLAYDDFPHPRAHLLFPPLDRPASREDVEKTTAIFSLEGEDERRVVAMIARPLRANWVTLKSSPLVQNNADPKVKPDVLYNQGGRAWQAEEVFRDGRWRRFYGFVGPHVVAKVPAEELDFVDHPFGSERPADGIDVAFSGPNDPSATRFDAGNKPGAPLVVSLRLRDRSGFDRDVPTSFVREEAGKVVAIRRGVEIRVDRAPPGTRPLNPQIRPKVPIAWAEVPMRAIARIEPDGATRTLRPSESFDACAIDIGRLFDLGEKGLYRVRLTLGPESGLAPGTVVDNLFVVGEVEVPPAREPESQSYE